ncbi:hypothetical protein AVEN_125581-1 [Araneus ventricosus]|uniref:Uncharacterized protein n=1 Tax=Araneus ventricosus TaxID=182803 RepID=A0A4Y2N7C3_ARAVE|nr:hypothetical protein AVEN_125581-1 [Araneus ventricosus]
MISKQHLIADEGNLNQPGRLTLTLCLGEMANTVCCTAVDPTTETHTSLRPRDQVSQGINSPKSLLNIPICILLNPLIPKTIGIERPQNTERPEFLFQR